ncbi:MAG: hypothetical protein AB1807_16850 [Pseudomonadota bacterium]
MTKTTPEPIFPRLSRLLLTCALAGACGMAAASPDQDKLRLLSCAMPNAAPTAHKETVDWFNQTAEPLARDEGHRIAGPVTLGKACLRNVTVAGGFGVAMMQGDICNERLEDFSAALASAGIALGKDALDDTPGVVLSKVGKEMQYLVTEGRMDPVTGKVTPGATPYSFTCLAAFGGPQ